MGLFDKLYNKKQLGHTPTDPSQQQVTHKQDWDFYFSDVDDIIGSFYLDLGLAKIAPVQNRPTLLWVSVTMDAPRADGLSSTEEFPTLSAIGDRLQEHILQNLDSIYAGRLTTDGRRDFYFYMDASPIYDKFVSEAMVAFPSYTFDFGVKEDAGWNLYTDFIYPNPSQFQSIKNRRVIQNLEKNGDPLTKPRPVDHWIYFKTMEDRKTFLDKIADQNFNIIDAESQTSSVEYPYKLHISRIDHVDLSSVDEYVLDLWQLALDCNGDYDGWETSVQKDP